MEPWLIVIIVVGSLIGAFLIVRFLVIPLVSKRPGNLGVSDGKLAPCKTSPNCVSTQADPTDEEHFIKPIQFSGSIQEAQDKILNTLKSIRGNTKIIKKEPNYIYVENRTPLMGFADDVEFYFDEATKTIHFRSCSRLGYSDLGVNRQRMESIREAYQSP